MKVAFDLDGTLDRPALATLAKELLAQGHEIHIMTGIFDEAGSWQSEDAKRQKLRRLGIPFYEVFETFSDLAPQRALVYDSGTPAAHLHLLHAADTSFPIDYRLRDLGLRKGALCEAWGITLFYDDSEVFCDVARKMAGNLTVLRVM